MIRYIALSVMLLPGIAHAQKFVSPTDGSDATVVQPTVEQPADSFTVASTESAEGAAVLPVSLDEPIDDDVVINATPDVDLPDYVAPTNTSGDTSVNGDTMIARVVIGEDGESTLTLAIAGSTSEIFDESTSASDAANFEIGECNSGTDWVNDDANCWNYYPAADD